MKARQGQRTCFDDNKLDEGYLGIASSSIQAIKKGSNQTIESQLRLKSRTLQHGFGDLLRAQVIRAHG